MSNESLILNGSMITFIQGNLTNFDIKTLVPWRYTAESTQLKESTIFYDDSKVPKYGMFDQSNPIRYVNNKITYVPENGNNIVMYGNVIMCRALVLTDGQLTSIPLKVRVVFNQVDLTNPNTRYITFACAHQNYTGRYFVGASLYYADLSFSNFTRCRLNNADFRDTILYGCDFTGANLAVANISGCDIGSIIIDKNTNIDSITTRRYIRATQQNIWIKQSKAMVYKLENNTLDITLKTNFQNIKIGNANSHGVWKPSSNTIPHPIYFSKRNHMNVCHICFLCPGGTNLEGLNLQGCDISNMDLKDAILVGCDISSVIINENTDLYNVVLVDERANAQTYKHSVIQNSPIIYRSSYSSRNNITIRLGPQNIIIGQKNKLIKEGHIVFKGVPMCSVNKDGVKVTKLFSVYCAKAVEKNDFHLLFLVPGVNLSGINMKGCDLSGLDLAGANFGDAIIDMNTDIKDIVVWNPYTNLYIVQNQPIIYSLIENQKSISIKWGDTSNILCSDTNITHFFKRLSDDIFIYIYASLFKTEFLILIVCPGVNLTGFNLRGCDLRDVNLTDAVLFGSDISSIIINENTDLNNVVLLDENIHSHTYKHTVIQNMPILYRQSNTSNTHLTIKIGAQNVILTEIHHLLQNEFIVFKGLSLSAIGDYGKMVTKTYSVYCSKAISDTYNNTNSNNNDFHLIFLVPGINFSDMNLQRCDLSDLDLAGANFSGAVIDKETNFRNMIVWDEKREWFIKQERPFIYRSDSGPEASEEITLKYSDSNSEQDAVLIGSKSSMYGASESFDLRMRDSKGSLGWIKTRIYFSKISNDDPNFHLYILLPFVNLRNVYLTDVDLKNMNLSSANLVGSELGGAYLNEHTNMGDVVLCDDNTGRSILQSGPLKYVLEDNTAKTLTIKLKSTIFTIGTVVQQTGVSKAFQTRAININGELVNRNTFVYFKKSNKNVTNFDYEIYFLLPGVRFSSNTFLNLENCDLSGMNLIGIDISGASLDKNTNIGDMIIWDERTSTSIVQNNPMTYKLLESQTDLSIMCGEKPFYFGITVASFEKIREQMSEPFQLKALSNDGTSTNIIVRIYIYIEPTRIYQKNLQSLSMYIICPGLNHRTRDFSAFNWKDMHFGGSDLTNASLAGAKLGGAYLNEHTDMKDIIYVVEEKNKQTIYVIQDEPLKYKPADLDLKDLTIKCGNSRYIVGNKSDLPTVTKNILPAKILIKNIKNDIKDITLTTYISSKNNAGHYFLCFLFPGINLTDMNLENCDLCDLDLSNTNFVGANLSGIRINENTNIRNIQLWNEKYEKYVKQDTPIIYTWNYRNRKNIPFKVRVGQNLYVMPSQSNSKSPGIFYTSSILSMDTQNTMQTRTCSIYYRYTNRPGIGHMFFLLPGVFLAGTDLRGCNLSGFNMLNADLSGATINTTTIFNNVIFYDERSRISVKIHRPISYVLVNNQNQISLSIDVNNIIVIDAPSKEYSPNIFKNFMGKAINMSGNIVDAQVPVYYKKREKKTKTDIDTFFDFIFIVHGVNLAGVDLSGCDLSGADLSRSDVGGAILNRSTNIGSVVLWNEVDGKFNYVIQSNPMIYVVHFGEQETDISLLNGSAERIFIGHRTDLRSVSQKFSVRVLNADEQFEERTVAIYAEKIPSHSDDQLHFQLYFLCPGVDLSGKDLSGLDLSNLDMSECNLRGANLVGTQLNGTIFNKNTFIGKNLLYDERAQEYLPGDRFRMHMILPQDLRLKTEGGKYINKLNEECTMQFIDRKGATRDFVVRVIFKRYKEETGQRRASVRFVAPFSDFRGHDLSDANLSNTDLRGCDFRGANLQNINLNDSDLDGIWIDQNTNIFNAVATNIRGKAYYCQDDGNVVLLTTGHMKTMHNIYTKQKDNRICFFLAVKKFTNTIINIVYESKRNLFLFSSTGNTIVKDEYVDLNNLTCPNFGLLSTVPFPYECRSLETSKVRFLVSENEPYIANKVPLDTYELNSYTATGFLYLYESVNTKNMTQTYFDILLAYGTEEEKKRGRYILHRKIPVMDGNRYVEKIVYATKNITCMLDSKTDIHVFEYLEQDEKFFVKIQDTIYEPSVHLTTNFIYPPSNYSIVLKIKTNNYFS